MSKKKKLLVFIIFCGGIFLRLCAFSWNTTIFGDVNLFALTAREFRRHTRLNYPMKYEYSDYVPYKTLSSPATQHPPLFPLLAGALGKILNSENSFAHLKFLCFASGALLLLVSFFYGKNLLTSFSPSAGLLVLLLFSASPALTDFSTNGSPYILCALELLAASYLLAAFRAENVKRHAAFGILCAVSLLTHSVMVCLIPAYLIFLLYRRGKHSATGLFVFSAIFLVILSPWLAFNLHHFKTPFYSYSRYDILKRLGMAQVGISGGVITTYKVPVSIMSVIRNYLPDVFKTTVVFVSGLCAEAGFFGCLLCAAGFLFSLQKNKVKLFSASLPFLAYIFFILAWGTYRTRYLVPALPAFYLLAAAGFFALKQNASKTLRFTAWIFLSGAILAPLNAFLDNPPMRYYEDSKQVVQHDRIMRTTAEILKEQPRGIVLGYTDFLAGGVEAVYWHDFPFVHGRDILGDKKALHKLILDFHPRYVWTDKTRLPEILHLYPAAKIVFMDDPLCILELPRKR